jgi:hypothetical protein
MKYVIYADDGLFYSDKDIDFIKEAQTVLDKYGVGAYFNLKKSNYVKSEGKWLNKLKLVGLIYDPETDILSASTRNGATLELKIGSIGIFTNMDQAYLELSHHARWIERDEKDWMVSNEKLSELYEKIYLLQGYKSDMKNTLYNKLSMQIVSIIKNRLKKYTWNDIACMEGSDDMDMSPLTAFVYPFAILWYTDKDSYLELKDEYENVMGESFPKDVVETVKRIHFMMSDLGVETYNAFYKEGIDLQLKDNAEDVYTKKVDWVEDFYDNTATNLVLNQLVWFKHLDEVPDNIKILMGEDNKLDLGEWYELEKEDREKVKIPKMIADYLEKHGGRIGYTEVNWRNLYMDPAFATFIARLFQNTFRSNVVKQNFRLDKDRSVVSMMTLIDRYIGRYNFNELQGGLNIFNATSFCSNLLMKFLESWEKSLPRKLRDPYVLNYGIISKRIVHRRSLVDNYAKDNKPGEPYFGGMYWKQCFPLTPHKLKVNDRIKRTTMHLQKKYCKEKIHSFTVETIARSMIAIQEIYTKHHANPRSSGLYPYKSVRWDTFSPKKTVRKPFVLKWRLNPKETDSSHPLVLTKTYKSTETGPWVPVIPKQKVNITRYIVKKKQSK